MSSRSKSRKKRRHALPRRPGGEILAEAIRKHQGGEVARAAELYRQVLARRPDDANALHFLGMAEHQLGNSQVALDLLGRVLKLAPAYFDAWNNRGNVLKQLGRLEEAEADYLHALALRPDDPNTESNLGSVRRARGDLEGAEKMFRQVIARRPDHANAWQNLGNTLEDLDRRDEALTAHREALRLAPGSVDSYRHMGAVLQALGRVDEAKEVLREWLVRFPDDPRAQHFVAACSEQSVPSRASDDCVRVEFDGFAQVFDALLARLEYRGPDLVAGEVARLFPEAAAQLAVLDAGCGTGLCGPGLRSRSRHLTGVDLSPAMIEVARRRGLYDVLAVAELTAHIQAHPAAWDLIVSADTLVYFGDLGELVRVAARALLPGGALVFTVEAASPDVAPHGFRLNLSGRYSHTRDYLCQVLADAGFVGVTTTAVNLRKEGGQWVDGYLISGTVSSPSP
jgi:predicted TPR repeat methyltransferase